MTLVITHRKTLALEPALAGWFTAGSIIGAAFLLLAVIASLSV